MKKAYMTPEMETVDLKINCAILADSLNKNGNPITDPNQVLAPGMDFDEEEEDW